jgi:DNA-binding NarL/FixJ family response regulator
MTISPTTPLGPYPQLLLAPTLATRKAIAAINRLRPDIVVVDLRLKGGTGIEVVRQVRAQAPDPAPRLLVLTNYASAEYKDACLASGADAFFDKTPEYGDFLSLTKQEAQRSPRRAGDENGSE